MGKHKNDEECFEVTMIAVGKTLDVCKHQRRGIGRAISEQKNEVTCFAR
jgi:hypothetical protein